MTARPRLPVFACGLVPILLAAALCLYRPTWLTPLEYTVHDTLIRAAPTYPPAGRIVIVDVDERSLSVVGQWPWRRDVIGQLITRLRDLGAATVALDVMFAEPDRSGTTSGGDLALAETMRAGRVVLGYAMTFDRTPDGSNACVQHPLGLAIVRRGSDHVDDPFFEATGAVCSLPFLTEAAGASGFLNAAPDPDGRLRRVPLMLEYKGRVYPGLALAAVAQMTSTRDVSLDLINVNTSSLVFGDRMIPLDGKSNLLLRYRGRKRTFPYVSAADVLNGRASAGDFAGKLVFVGTTALGTREVVATPLDTLFAGVEVQATVADNLLQRDFIHRPEHGVVVESQITLGLGILVLLLVRRMGLAWGAAVTAALLAGVWGVAIAQLSSDGRLLSPLYPTLGLTGALAAITAASFTTERKRADRAGADKVTSQRLMVQTLLSLTEVRDAETGQHSRRTQHYARVLAEELARHDDYRGYLTRERIDLLSALAPLHDIGKVGIPDRLLKKPGPLAPDEMAEMRRHPEYGRDVIVNAEKAVGVHDDQTLAMAKDIVYTHHEKWDGTGYPQGLRGANIPIPGRVMAIVDVYDAVTTRRLYKLPMSQEDAVSHIVSGRGTHFDPVVVDAFVRVAPDLGMVPDLDAADAAS
jgi:CHASE2 domain-containing sensor protein